MSHCPQNKIKFMNFCINNFYFFIAIINFFCFVVILFLIYKNHFYNNYFYNDDLICTVKRPFVMLSDLNKYYNNTGIQIKNNNNNKKKLKNNNNNKKKIKNNNSNNNNNFNNEKNPFSNNLKCNICGMNIKVSYHTINKLLNINYNNNNN